MTRGRLNDLPLDQEQSALLMEEIEEINIGDVANVHKIHLAQSLNPLEKKKFIQFFKQRYINLAWSYADMPGLDPELVLHHLPLLPGTKPYKKNLSKMHPQITLLVKIEVQKLLDVGFIRPIDYAEWISNLFLVTKNTGGIIICTNFRDLNKACPKVDFLLPNIDMIVDLTAGNEMLSLMEGFSGYNQIKIAIEDQAKTTFTCPWGTYCWNIVPFGLKNASATYQRAMTTVFHDMMHDIMEDYFDNILAKSRTREDHLEVLAKIFDRLEQYKVRLNPKKCVFGVIARNLLGFIVSNGGIEVDLEKVKAILEMPAPTTLKQLRSLQGRLQSIRRFIIQLADKCHPFQYLLNKGVMFKWTEQCQEAFQSLKHYLLNQTNLSATNSWKTTIVIYVCHKLFFGCSLSTA